MSAAPNLDAYIQMLNSALMPGYVRVDHAWTMEPLTNVADNAPALMVFPGFERVSPHDTCSQEIHAIVNHWIICKSSELHLRREDLRQAALGYDFGPEYLPLEIQPGNESCGPEKVQGDYIWWAEYYQVGYRTHEY